MDTSQQLYESAATGWRRGLYDDVKRTFRAPVVNWIFRTATANDPEFTRYAWGQVKPVFETRGFARFSVQYRDAVLSALDVPAYRPSAVDLSPAEFAELRGQLATFDVVAPRLAVLFETMDRALHDDHEPTPPDERWATRPFPDWLDRDRGSPPSMVETPPDALDETLAAIRAFHGFDDDSLPSIYRCLAQWPSFLDALWADVEPLVESDAFETARRDTADLTDAFVSSTPYRPRLAPDDLRGVGMDDDAIEGVQGLFRRFNTGPVETVLPALPAFAATVDAAGERSLG
ncbi:halocarboxylic acid dehydrogenase DehI family protein [Halomarina rubra]|uniref:Halocarboxylic acid dehydrogenase DehI family protein n=1 Tax=Halomarina rubra TaxID=2071873 RepID=A0ABD6AUN9_9EURY|nr:halocarboxylic acid dehydrogenase DehI family protein [Halomarina rubra]